MGMRINKIPVWARMQPKPTPPAVINGHELLRRITAGTLDYRTLTPYELARVERARRAPGLPPAVLAEAQAQLAAYDAERQEKGTSTTGRKRTMKPLTVDTVNAAVVHTAHASAQRARGQSNT